MPKIKVLQPKEHEKMQQKHCHPNTWKVIMKALQLKEHEKMQRKHCHPNTWKVIMKALQSKKHEKGVAKALQQKYKNSNKKERG